MKHINIILLSLAAAAGCGISPQDAADELNYSSVHSEEWCDFNPAPPGVEVDKASNHPNGYGITALYGCFEDDTTWPGGFCFAPFTKNWTVKIFQDGQSSEWFKNATDEYGATQNVLSSADWSVTRVSGSSFNMAIHTGTTNPNGSGTLGASLQSSWINLGNITGQGDYWTYAYCEAWLFKASIEANGAYQSASAAQKTRYLKNLWQHEYGH